MRRNMLAISAALAVGVVAAPATSFAGWANRTSPDVEVVPTHRMAEMPPVSSSRLPTRSERLQGMPPYQAFSNSPYAQTIAPPPPLADPAKQPVDPVYFHTVMGH